MTSDAAAAAADINITTTTFLCRVLLSSSSAATLDLRVKIMDSEEFVVNNLEVADDRRLFAINFPPCRETAL